MIFQLRNINVRHNWIKYYNEGLYVHRCSYKKTYSIHFTLTYSTILNVMLRSFSATSQSCARYTELWTRIIWSDSTETVEPDRDNLRPVCTRVNTSGLVKSDADNTMVQHWTNFPTLIRPYINDPQVAWPNTSDSEVARPETKKLGIYRIRYIRLRTREARYRRLRMEHSKVVKSNTDDSKLALSNTRASRVLKHNTNDSGLLIPDIEVSGVTKPNIETIRDSWYTIQTREIQCKRDSRLLIPETKAPHLWNLKQMTLDSWYPREKILELRNLT